MKLKAGMKLYKTVGHINYSFKITDVDKLDDGREMYSGYYYHIVDGKPVTNFESWVGKESFDGWNIEEYRELLATNKGMVFESLTHSEIRLLVGGVASYDGIIDTSYDIYTIDYKTGDVSFHNCIRYEHYKNESLIGKRSALKYAKSKIR